MSDEISMSMLNHPVSSCVTNDGAVALSVTDARHVIEQLIEPIQAIERVDIRSALGRVLARDVISSINVPAHDNAAMDGYAFNADGLLETSDRDVRLRLVGTVTAGQSANHVTDGQDCVRIMTGALMPDHADTVVPQEWCASNGDVVSIQQSYVGQLKRGDNRRFAGEDLAVGQAALKRGKVLKPADIGLLASLGLPEVEVMRTIRVAFFSTGNELRSIGEPLAPGQVYDSNRYTLYCMLRRLGCEVMDMGVVGDDPAALEAALRQAAESADAIITSGGVSVGEADYIKQTIAKLGDVAFWSLAMRPGRPMAFGRIESNHRSAYFFGLPGNPVAVMVTFYQLVRAALLRLQGANDTPLLLLRARAAMTIRKRAGRTEYQRGVLTNDGSGQPIVRLTGQQGSGVLRSMSEANCFIVLRHEQGDVQAGDEVNLMLFDSLL